MGYRTCYYRCFTVGYGSHAMVDAYKRCRDYLDADTLPGAMKFTNILVVRSTRVTAVAIAAGPVLSLIIRAGAGVDTIDLAAGRIALVQVGHELVFAGIAEARAETGVRRVRGGVISSSHGGHGRIRAIAVGDAWSRKRHLVQA